MDINQLKLKARYKLYMHLDAIIGALMERVAEGDSRCIVAALERLIPALADARGESTEPLQDKDLESKAPAKGLSPEVIRAIKRDLLGIHEVKPKQQQLPQK